MKKKNNIWIGSLFLIGVLFILVSSCKDEDPEPNQSALLIGAWEQVSQVSSNCTDPSNNGIYTCTSHCEAAVATATTITFDGEGPYTYTVKGSAMTVDFGGDFRKITISISGTTLTMTYQSTVPEGGCKFVTTYKQAEADIDGNVFHSVTIGTQVWMVENLKVTKYNDGTQIPMITDNTEWANLTNAAYCWYGNDEAGYKDDYGALYNWYAVNTGKLSPKGWHVATDAEWATLINYLGGESIASGKLKEAGTLHWQDPNTEATNSSGFTGLPGGTRYNTGSFDNMNFVSYWWTATGDPGGAWYRELLWNEGNAYRYGHLLTNGMSVRCVKD